ncbi:Acid ceramidase [Daphnia magna]|uniref:Acid ceramidase n=1 Tax=Daphnia magna TaxID=35525 RepID=A0A164KEV0_9CRUS|nr:Acid ceramidase [Daphnia magna]
MKSFGWLHMFKLYSMLLAFIFVMPSVFTQVWNEDFDNEHFLYKIPENVSCADNQYPPLARVPTYVINLDLPPKLRWAQLMIDKKESALHLLQDIKTYTDSFFHGKLFPLLDKYLPLMAKTLPEPYLSELEGIAEVTGIELGEITLYNIFYEVFTFWDVKNHTWQTTEALRPLVVELDFQREGHTVYKTVNFAGYVGVLTGMKPQRFTLTLDERFSMEGGFVGIIRWLLGDHSANWAGFLMRDVMEKADSYQQALTTLTTSKLLAPVYFILGGNTTDQGAIITRGRNEADVWFMGRGSVSQVSTWYLVETNYDHWNKPPFFDDRRTPAVHCLDKMGREAASLSGLFNVLATKPIFNKLTAYTCLMDVSTGRFESWIRNCPDPCKPW